MWLSIAVGGLFAALGIPFRVAFFGAATTVVPYVTFFPMIAIAAFLGGWSSGIAATVFSAVILNWFIVPLSDLGNWTGLLFFAGGTMLATGAVERLSHAERRTIKAEAAKKAWKRGAARDALLSKTAARLLESHEPQRILHDICKEAADFLDCSVFFNFLLDKRFDHLHLNACAGVSREEAERVQRLECGGPLCRRLGRGTKRVLIADSAARCPQTELLDSLGIRSYCCHPLLEQGRIIGTLTFADRRQSNFHPSMVEFMESLSRLISLALSRIRMETALRESEERFSCFMRHLKAFAWVKDADGRYVFANEALAKATRWPLEQISGKTDEELFGAATAIALKANDRLALEKPFGLTTVEHLVDEGGTKRHYLVSKFPIHLGHEQKTYVGGVAIDDTQRVQAEDRLKDVSEKLREADRRKNEFLATLAHELRNPLAPIRSGLYVLRRTSGQGPKVDVNKLHDVMERQIEHLVRLVDDLLEVSRISRGVIELRKEPLDFASVIHAAVEMSRELISASNLELRIDLPQEPLRLEADPVRLTQVIANLLNNAAKYTDPGGSVEVRAERQGDEVIVTVADTGVGIPANMLPRVFDLFAQVNRTLGRAQGGLGIGLALVRDLVGLHGGSVEAMSEGEGKGSRFVVRLPLPPSAFREAPVRCETKPPAPPPRRVLVVDDMRDTADSLAQLLETFGSDVRVAYDGGQALDELAKFRPEVVFLDIGMPEMDGFETARRVRACSQGRDVTLVALTGWGEEETRKRVEAGGFDHHLTKPAELDELRQVLEFSCASAGSLD